MYIYIYTNEARAGPGGPVCAPEVRPDNLFVFVFVHSVCLWPMASGLWPMASGLWPMALGLWPMAHGPWPVIDNR